MQHQLAPQIQKAIGAHGAWKMRLKTAINTGIADITPQKASCDDGCEFGKWLYGADLTPQIRAGMPYQVVRRLHAEFHQSAGHVLASALAGQAAVAQRKMDEEFTPRSEKLVRALHKWMREVT